MLRAIKIEYKPSNVWGGDKGWDNREDEEFFFSGGGILCFLVEFWGGKKLYTIFIFLYLNGCIKKFIQPRTNSSEMNNMRILLLLVAEGRLRRRPILNWAGSLTKMLALLLL